MAGKRFIFLTQYYPPEPGAASIRIQAMVHQLIRRGHAVTVVTAQAHHLGATRQGTAGGLMFREDVNGVAVIRTWIWRIATGRFWLRLLNYFSFVLTSFFGLWSVGMADYLVVESPPLFLGITAYLYGRWKKIPYILSVSDLWPESAVALGLVKNRILIRFTRRLEHFLYRHAAFVSGVTRGIQDGVLTTGEVSPDRLLFFPNGVDRETFSRVDPDPELVNHLGIRDKAVFLYPGTLGYAQGLSVIVEAAEMLQDYPDIVFLLVGEGPVKPELERMVQEKGLNNVLFEPLQPVERMARYFSLARGVVVPLRKNKLFKGARPSKVFPAWSVGTPVIYSGEGEMADLVEEARGGVVVPPEDSGALAMAVEFLSRLSEREWRQMGEAGRMFVLERYTWDGIMDQWLKGLNLGG